MGDLRSQLLKAGLVTEKKLKEVEAESRKQRKEKRGKRQAEPDPEQVRRKRELEEAQAKDRERQRRKHEERERRRQRKVEAEQKAREQAELGRQIIQTGGIALDPESSFEYRFAGAEGVVRGVRVSAEQRDRAPSVPARCRRRQPARRAASMPGLLPCASHGQPHACTCSYPVRGPSIRDDREPRLSLGL